MVDRDALLTAEEKELFARSFETEVRRRSVPLKKIEKRGFEMFEVF